ncbi:TonB-dependent siderophore receptor [Tianweitania populi]|uniref:Ligand-gated channel n=1 Tax=Tianweitania populi TaxID=1607949 RepID=A0A8J3GMX4_9HYPH|nr:TonB-dependent siderophore receptor [Tianweitania populi]GHD22976.1 ligand-gated channel [Tianweitania populi]
MLSRRWLTGASFVALASVLAATPAWSQAVQLETVVVQGEGGAGNGTGTSAVEGYVADETRTGSKTDTPIEEIPQAVSVLGREEIDDRGAQKVDEALRYTAGVFTQPFGADSDTNWIYIRGFDATQTGTYQDGLQLQSYAFGAYFIDSFLLERIETLKGPASAIYGSSNPGGIVNYVSKRPNGETFKTIEAGIDTNGTGYVGFDAGGSFSEAVDYRLVGRLFGGNGYTDFEEQFRGVISPSITWSPDAATSLTVLANYTHMDLTHSGGTFLPYVGTVVDAPYGKISRDANFTEPDIDDYDRQQASIGYEFAHTFDNNWTFRQNARIGVASIEEAYLYPNGYADLAAGELARVNFSHDTDINSQLIDNQIEGAVKTGELDHTLLGGFEYKRFNIDQIQSSALFGTTTPISAFDPIYGVPQPSGPVSYINQDLTQQQVGFYAQDQIRFGGGWLATLNGRYDHVWTETENRPNFYGLTEDAERDSGEWTGRAGLAYEFENGIVPYASVASFFNPVIGTTGDGALFKPETGEQYEVGVKYKPTSFDGLFTVALFDLTRQNVPTTDPTNIFAQVQTGEIRSRGIELEGKVNLNDNWRLTAAFTTMDLEVTKDTDATIVGNQPFLIPETQASAFVDYTFTQGALTGLSLGGGVRFVGSSYADRANTLKVPDVTLADARIGYTKDNWSADVTVSNLFDEKFVSGCQGELVCSYGEGRKALFKISSTW